MQRSNLEIPREILSESTKPPTPFAVSKFSSLHHGLLGDVRAQTALSDFYFKGIGVRRDYVRAYTWASIATGGQSTDDGRLKALRPRMTAAQLEDANRRTAAWFAGKAKL